MNNRVAAISMVKNECDVIELFIKINARIFDHIFIVDHSSSDGTREIMEAMRRDGYPLTVGRYEMLDFNQAKVLTGLARDISARNAFDYIVPLDADEFIYCPQGPLAETLRREISASGCGKMAWRTYVPINDRYFQSQAPLYENFRMRKHEPKQFYKVVVTNELAKSCKFFTGSNRVERDGQIVPAATLSCINQHVPIRGVEQLIIKAILGSHRLSIKMDRREGEGFQKDEMASRIRQCNYQLSNEDILDIASGYATQFNAASDRVLLDESAPRIGTVDDAITLRDLAAVNLLKVFDGYLGELCAEIRSARGIVASA
jgi:glycosyltransferase involved in cell wall biosynthesis